MKYVSHSHHTYMVSSRGTHNDGITHSSTASDTERQIQIHYDNQKTEKQRQTQAS